MRRARFAVTAVIAILGCAVGVAGAAMSVVPDIPTVFTGQTSYAVRPHRIVVISADGGQLTVRWTRWTSQQAIGSGTSRPDHGAYPITVRLSDPRFGTFQRLTTTFYLHHRISGTDPMRLAQNGSMVIWADPAVLRGNSSLVTDAPAGPAGQCGAGALDAVSGVHGLTIRAACAMANADVNAGGVGCGSVGASPARTGVVDRPTYLGYRVTPAGDGAILFMRASDYFTFSQQCM